MQIFPHKAFCLFFVAEMFHGVALSVEAYSVLKIGCTPGRPPWLADKSKETFGYWNSKNIHFFNDFIISNVSIFNFSLYSYLPIFHSNDT